MAKRSLVRCRSGADNCGTGVLGAWADGAFYPSGHVVPGRNLYITTLGTYVQCTFCGSWHIVREDSVTHRLVITVDNTLHEPLS